jgi:hypothetical protein
LHGGILRMLRVACARVCEAVCVVGVARGLPLGLCSLLACPAKLLQGCVCNQGNSCLPHPVRWCCVRQLLLWGCRASPLGPLQLC